MEETDPQTGVFYLDARGLERLWGDGAAVARAALQALRAQGMAARAGGGPSRVVALACAQHMGADGPTVLGGVQAARFLAALPLQEPTLGLPLRVATALQELGIRTAGALATLPAAGLALRFGPEAVAAWQRAGGQGDRMSGSSLPLHAVQVARVIAVDEHWEDGLADMLLLEEGLARLCGRLAAALAADGLATAHLTLHLECGDGTRHLRTSRCWPPRALSAPLERAARLLLAHPVPPAPITRLTLESRGLCAPYDDQLGLWDAKAVTRRQERLDEALDAHTRKHPSASFTRLRRDPLSPEGWQWENRERAT
jgi:protein ImuB